MSAILQCGKHQLDLSRPHIMGILNITPDSFSDGGQYNTLDAALHRAGNMLEAGASLLDVGGESTRPGAQAVSPQQELDRVAPLVEALVKKLRLYCLGRQFYTAGHDRKRSAGCRLA